MISFAPRNWLLAAAAILPLVAGAAEPPPILEAEISDEATLPEDNPHRFFTLAIDNTNKGIVIFDGDSGKLEAQLPAGFEHNLAFSPDSKRIYVAETVWSRGNRGDRGDLLAVYDAATLHLRKDIVLPGRALADLKMQNLAISAGGKQAYIYNMHPASSVIRVDLAREEVAGSVEVPGCSLIFPFGDDGFASLCGDGALATVTFDQAGVAKVVHGKPFFDANKDPIFENSPSDPATGRALFISYTGLVYPARLGPLPVIEKPWSIQRAAGQPVAGTGEEELAWRPGGVQFAAWHRASDRLYVLMHPGNYWSHKSGGQEIWVLDVKSHALVARFAAPVSASGPPKSMVVTQDGHPQLYLVNPAGNDVVMDAMSGEVLRRIDIAAGDGVLVPGN